jgi:hypothetical protein
MEVLILQKLKVVELLAVNHDVTLDLAVSRPRNQIFLVSCNKEGRVRYAL